MPSEPPMLTEKDVRPARAKKPSEHKELDPIANALRTSKDLTISEASKLIGDNESNLAKNKSVANLLRSDHRFLVFMEGGQNIVILSNAADVPPPEMAPEEPPAVPIDVPTLGERLANAQAIAGDAPIATSVSEPISPKVRTNRDALRSDLDGWEEDAKRFHQATGFLRPGKDSPAAAGPIDEEAQRAAWNRWLEEPAPVSAVISTAPAAPVTPEDRLRFELGCHQKRAAKLQELSQKYMRLSSEATTLQSDLNDKREEMKETAKMLASLAGTPVELQQPIPFGQATGDKPAEGVPAAEEDLLAGDPLAVFKQWAISEEQVKCFEDVEFNDADTTPDDLANALAANRIQPSEKPQPVTAVHLYEAPYLVIDGMEGGPFLLVRLLTKDEWATLHEEKYGRCVIGFDQTDEAKDQRQLGGEHCGLVVKVGRKQLVIGPRPEEALGIYLDAGEPANAIDGSGAFDAKAAAAGEKPE